MGEIAPEEQFLPLSTIFYYLMLDFYVKTQGWAANSTPGIYQWHLPVFTGLENTPEVANTGKYWQIDFSFP